MPLHYGGIAAAVSYGFTSGLMTFVNKVCVNCIIKNDLNYELSNLNPFYLGIISNIRNIKQLCNSV